jgi:hypothetical protein
VHIEGWRVTQNNTFHTKRHMLAAGISFSS